MSRRSAFTLVEMLVVLAILLALTSITVAFYPRVSSMNKTSDGAAMVQAWFSTAKQRALRDQVPRGIRLLLDQSYPAGDLRRLQVKSLQYIELPDDIGDNGHQSTIAVSGTTATATGVQDFTGGLSDPVFYPVQPGDFLLVNDVSRFRIISVDSPTALKLFQAPGAVQLAGPSNEYKIMRSFRPLLSEPELKLPQDVVIDLNTNATYGAALPKDGGGNPYFLYTPRGGVLNTIGHKGLLWVRDSSQDSIMKGEPVLVCIYSGGFVGTQQVDTELTTGTPYGFTTQGY